MRMFATKGHKQYINERKMRKILTITSVLASALLLSLSSCNNDSDPQPTPTYTLTQAELNAATGEVETFITGKKYGQDVSIPHGGNNLTYDQTYRDVYSTTTKSTNDDAVGTIYTKRTYVKNADGSKGDLLATFAMAKHESGYYAAGGDWEYVMMPYDATNDYTANPNGMLPAAGSDMRGQLANCASCHAAAASSDYIFTKGQVPAYIANQTDLNKSTNEEDIGVTGTKYGADVSVPHNGQPWSPDSTYRDIYSSILAQEDINVGSIFTKKTYIRNADGSYGDLQVTFAMIKREPGYFTAGGDFEYVMMPNDGSNDYNTNPMGMLPPEGSQMRGQLANCAGCHEKATGSDYLFVR